MPDSETESTDDSTLPLPGRDGPPQANADDDVSKFLAALDEVEAGRRVGYYEVERSIGRGGMGEVFAARHVKTGERVALKWFGQGQATALHRFKREFRAVADVKHENLVSLHELVVLEDSRAFFTMELIDGKHFHKYVRGRTPAGQLPNMIRLRRAVRQLVAGIAHLHVQDFVHRDLKPSNVLVTREGRVVILDFGLVSERASTDMSLNPTGVLVGTPSYIAPEHAARQRADKPSDLYAIGVMLYQCLSGQLPFSGSSAVVLVRKQDQDAPPITERVAGVPAKLAKLCMRLLERDPELRPSAQEVLAELSEGRESTRSSATSHASLLSIPSRERLQQMLLGTLELVEETPVTVHLRHRSNADRGAVLDGFFDQLRRRAGDGRPLLPLRARCHARESVPYKGIDQLVDTLTLTLRNMGEDAAAALEPSAVSALLQMFPVLNSVWLPDSLAFIGADRGELRRFGVDALREVLVRAAERYLVVVCIEDFHWADIDGARLLSELVRPPDAPQMLLIVTYDETASDHAERGEAVLDELLDPSQKRGRSILELDLGALSEDEARALAGELAGDALGELDPDQRRRRLDDYVARAKGDPFFLGQLILGELEGDPSHGSLDDLVVHKLFALSHEDRQALAVICVSDGPCSPRLLEGCGVDEVDARVAALLELKLVRRVDHERLEVAHHTIREASLSALEGPELRALHRALAESMQGDDDPRLEMIAAHLEQASELERAVDYYERAADQAAQTLAFRRAAELYERALSLLAQPRERARERALELELADQLVAAGQGGEAIEVLERLARDAEPARARSIQRQIADLHIQAGRMSEGLAQLEPVFRSLGERVPQSRLGILSTLLWRRLRLWLRGKRYTLRAAEEIDPHRLEHLDTLLAVWTGISHQSPLHATMIHARYLRLALDIGEPLRLSRGFNYESLLELSRGRRASSDAYMASARELLASRNEPIYAAVLEYTDITRTTLAHEWREAAAAWPQLIDSLAGVAGAQYVRALAASRYAYVLIALGDYRTLDELAPKWLQLSGELGLRRDDANIAALAAMPRLVLDSGHDELGVKAMLERARDWDAPGYSMPNFHIDLSEIPRMIWRGEHEQALAAAARASEQAATWHLTIYEIVRYSLEELHGRTCALVYCRDPRRAELAERARAAAKRLRGGKHPMYLGQAEMIDAAICAAKAELDGARRHWRAACAAFEAAGMDGHLAAARVRLAEAGGEDSAAHQRGADAYFRAQNILACARFVTLFAPSVESEAK